MIPVGREDTRNGARARGAGVLLAAIVAFIVFGSTPSPRAQTAGLQKLFSDYYEFLLREDPGQATFAGNTEFNDRWNDPSPEHKREYIAALRQFTARLHAIPTASVPARDRLSYGLLDRQLKEKIEEANTISTFYSVN